jgi:GcrA cell cycle regulator
MNEHEPGAISTASSSRGTPTNEALRARIKELMPEHLSHQQMAALLGVSKNTVSGQVHRMREAGELPPLEKPNRFTPPPMPRSTITVLPVRRRYSPYKTCQYPHGHPKERGFRFCGEKTAQGSPYCPKHHRACYTALIRPEEKK